MDTLLAFLGSSEVSVLLSGIGDSTRFRIDKPDRKIDITYLSPREIHIMNQCLEHLEGCSDCLFHIYRKRENFSYKGRTLHYQPPPDFHPPDLFMLTVSVKVSNQRNRISCKELAYIIVWASKTSLKSIGQAVRKGRLEFLGMN